jgi:2-polyprenyl-3-methyl-5-hydroxy-6-metoxy-1,4-benzoquinol methylase
MTKNEIQNYLDTSFDHEGKAVQVSMTHEEHRALFDRIQTQWTGYGESEPFASVLSNPQFLQENIQANMHILEASGVEVVRRLQVVAARNQVDIPKGRCLELGCGVGRITRPLSQLFDCVVAADISPGNLAVCKAYVAEEGTHNVNALLLRTPEHIATVKDIDAFVSVIVLQHNPPPVQYFLLDSIFANIAPKGIAFFQAATFNPAYAYQIGQHLAMDTETFEGWSLHCLPMQHIFGLFRKHGLQVLEVIEDGQTGGLQNRFHSHTFFARKI